MAPKPEAATDTRPLKKVYLHPSGLQASVTLGVLQRQRPILSEPKQTMGQRLKAKWTCSKQARIYAKGEFIGCSGGTASVTVLERLNAESIYQGAVHLEAKRTAYSGWASTIPQRCLWDRFPSEQQFSRAGSQTFAAKSLPS